MIRAAIVTAFAALALSVTTASASLYDEQVVEFETVNFAPDLYAAAPPYDEQVV